MSSLRLGELARNNVNDNVVFRKKNNNDIVRVSRNLNLTRKARADHVDWIADRLVKELDAPNCRAFFAKCGWYLAEDVIWSALDAAKKPSIKSPARYFNSICKVHLSKLGK